MESVSFLGPKIQDILPKVIKNSKTLNIFKGKTKNWVSQECPCRHCKNYASQIRFILKNNNTITVKLYVLLSRLTSFSLEIAIVTYS